MSPRVAIAATALIVVSAGCGNGGELSYEDYVTLVEESSATYDVSTDEIFEKYSAASATALAEFDEATAGDISPSELVAATDKILAVTIAAITDAFEDVERAVETFVTELNGLSAPGEIERLHDEYVSTLQRSLDSIPQLVRELDAAPSMQSITGIINDSGFGDTQPRIAAACSALESIAGVRVPGADLRCASESDG